MKIFIWLLADIILGYLPQAAGCAIGLFALTNQRLKSRSFLYTSAIYAVIAIAIRLAYNFGLIDFGFHTVIIWMIFIVVAVAFNKAPVLQSTISILLSGILITLAEVITAATLMLTLGAERFDAIMNNVHNIDGLITKAFCGVPANFLFLIVIFGVYFALKRRRARTAASAAKAASTEADGES